MFERLFQQGPIANTNEGRPDKCGPSFIFQWLNLTFYRKALSIATNINLDVYHFCLFGNLRAMGGLDKSIHPHIKEKRSTIYVDKYSASFRCNGLEPFAKM